MQTWNWPQQDLHGWIQSRHCPWYVAKVSQEQDWFPNDPWWPYASWCFYPWAQCLNHEAKCGSAASAGILRCLHPQWNILGTRLRVAAMYYKINHFEVMSGYKLSKIKWLLTIIFTKYFDFQVALSSLPISVQVGTS